MLGKAKSIFKRLKEIREKKVLVQSDLDVTWQLIEDAQVLSFVKSLIFVVLPFIVEMRLNFSFELDIYGFIPVELFDGSEKLGEVVAVIEFCIEVLE